MPLRTPSGVNDSSATLLQQMFMESPAFMVVLTGPEYVFEMVNPAYWQMIGRDDLLGRPVFEVFPGLVEQGFQRLLDEVRTTGKPVVGREVPLVIDATPDHPALRRIVDFTYLPVTEPVHGTTRIIVHGMDVTELVEARERVEARNRALLAELEFDRERLRSLIRVMPIPVAIHSGSDHRFEIVSDGLRAVSGDRDITGMTPREAYPELVGSGIMEPLDEVMRTGVPWSSAETHARYDRRGQGIEDSWFNIRYEPVRDPSGTIVGILNISFDITDDVRTRRETQLMNDELSRQQREMERTNSDLHEVAIQLAARTLEAEDTRRDVERLLAESERARQEAEDARREAESANRGKAEFLAAMSHELRTPLNAIGGYAELIELGIRGPVTPAQAEDLQRIRVSQRHLLRLVNEILNYARIETGTVRYDVEDVALHSLVVSVEPLIAPQLAAKRLSFRFDSDGCPNVAARADREKTRQVLLNLLSNAIKFTPPGGRVDVVCEPRDAQVLIRVSDSGIGIAGVEQERVFEPFVQVDASLTRPHEGAGLGLAISRDLARGMGGDLTVSSRMGEGSTFTLSLPRVADATVDVAIG